jgi:hypothetical protein
MASFVALTLAQTGTPTTFVNPDQVERVEDIVAPGQAPPTAAVYMRADDPNSDRIVVQGTAAAVSAALAAASPAGASVLTYTPTVSSLAGDVVPTALGDWRVLRVGNRVQVWGLLQLDFVTPATPDTIIVSLPVPADFSGPGGSVRAPGLIASTDPNALVTDQVRVGRLLSDGNNPGQVECTAVADAAVSGLIFGLSFAYDAA